jgi:hypothetical protein
VRRVALLIGLAVTPGEAAAQRVAEVVVPADQVWIKSGLGRPASITTHPDAVALIVPTGRPKEFACATVKAVAFSKNGVQWRVECGRQYAVRSSAAGRELVELRN